MQMCWEGWLQKEWRVGDKASLALETCMCVNGCACVCMCAGVCVCVCVHVR